MEEVAVTRHGMKRLKERSGIPKKSAERQSNMAIQRGIPHGKMTGSLFKWVTSKALNEKKKGHYFFYNNSLFIFKDERLITIIPLPTNLLKQASNQLSRYQKQKEKEAH